jgi:heptosyltransferase-3
MSAPEPPRTVLFINVSRIGDTILATPAVRAAARAWPQARVTFLGHPKRVEVVEHLPYLAATGAIDKNRARFRGWLGPRRWDLAFVLGFDKPLVAYALRAASHVVAFRQDDARLDAKLWRCVERPQFQSLHAAEIPLLLTAAAGASAAGLRLDYAVTPDEKRWARETLARRLPARHRPLVGFQVASFPTKAFRDWPPGHFAALAEKILARWRGAHIVLFGGDADAARTRELAERLAGRATSFAGELALRQSAALMSELDLYVGVDTGPTHIMGALEPPMIALYHSHSPAWLLMPRERPGLHTVDHPRAGRDSRPEAPMAEIDVDTVWKKVEEALGARSFG